MSAAVRAFLYRLITRKNESPINMQRVNKWVYIKWCSAFVFMLSRRISQSTPQCTANSAILSVCDYHVVLCISTMLVCNVMCFIIT